MKTISRTLYYNGNIVTMDGSDTYADAVVVGGNRILAVGCKDGIDCINGIENKFDLQGNTLYPGFIDTHSHIDLFASWADYVWCGGEKNLDAALEKLKNHASSHPEAPIVMGYGYDDTAVAEKRGPNVKELDAIFGERPVVLVHISIHAAYVNTSALRMLGIDPGQSSNNIEVICENGLPTGMLTENMALKALALLPPLDKGRFEQGILAAMCAYNEQGFTSTIGGGLGLGGLPVAIVLQSLGKLELEGRMTIRCNLPFLPSVFKEALEDGLLAGPGSPFVRLHGLKLLTDGSIQAYTAAIPEGYYSHPEIKPEPIITQEKMDELVELAHANGQQVIAHGNGNGAIERALLSLERAQKKYPRSNPHHLLVHCQTASDSQLERMKKAGFEPTFFVLHVWNWGDRHRDIFLGPERAARIDPCGSAVRIGLPFSLHADTPVLPQMTMQSIHTAVNRITANGQILGPDQRVSPLEAMRAYTVYAAGMCLDSHNRGSIEPGKLADFTLLSDDPRKVPHEEIKNIKILSTITGGRPSWGILQG